MDIGGSNAPYVGENMPKRVSDGVYTVLIIAMCIFVGAAAFWKGTP
jgi:hypothetical protein